MRDEVRRPDRLVWEDAGSVAFAPYASRSPFEVWIVPRRHEADFGRIGPADIAATAEALRQVLARLADSLDGPPYNLVLHTAPLREQVDSTYHWHWEIHPRLREIAGLELGTGLPVNPVSPEDAVEELLGRADAAGRCDGLNGVQPGTRPRHTGGRSVVLGLASAPRHRRVPRPILRTEPTWPSTVPSPTSATRSPDRRVSGHAWGAA